MIEKEDETYRQLYWLVIYKWNDDGIELKIHCLQLPYTKRENMEDVEMEVISHHICELELDSERDSKLFKEMKDAKLKVLAYQHPYLVLQFESKG